MALQTKTFTKAGDKGYGLKLVLTENSTSVTANTSSVSYSFYITRGGMGFFASYPFSWNIKIGGQTIAISNFKFQISTSDPAEQLIKSGTVTVAHNSDGSKTMSFDVSTPDATFIAPTNAPTAMRMTGEWKLTTIPRASSLSAINTDIGSDTLITISRASAAFTHTVTYKFGDLTGTIATKTAATSIPWTVPDSFYGEIPNAKYGTVTLTCQTYSGSTLLGRKTATFRATASEALCKPDVSGRAVVTDELTKGLTGNDHTVIRYVSEVEAAITATPKNGATIASRTVNGKALTDTLDFPKAETGAFVFAAMDSRGFITRVNKTLSLVPYVKLTANGTVKRDTPTGSTGKLTIQGNYFNASFGAQSNALTVQYRLQPEGEAYGDWQTATVTLDGNTYRAAVSLTELDYRKAYRVQVQASDKLMTTTADLTMLPGTPVFEWGKGDFRFHVPVEILGSLFSKWCKIDAGAGMWTSLSMMQDGETETGFTIDPESRTFHLMMYAKGSRFAERYIIRTPSEQLSEDKYYYLLTSKIATDYVTAQGTSGGWYWQKWNSGKAACWRTLAATAPATKTWGGVYYSVIRESDLPFPFTFAEVPSVRVQLAAGGSDAWLTASGFGDSGEGSVPTAQRTGMYSLTRGTAKSSQTTVRLHYYAVGRWK